MLRSLLRIPSRRVFSTSAPGSTSSFDEIFEEISTVLHKPAAPKPKPQRAQPDQNGQPRYRARSAMLSGFKPYADYNRRSSRCGFCNGEHTEMDYTNVAVLLKYINERGMIMHRRVNQTCAKHQRKLATTVKRARQVGLLSHINNWRVPASFLRDGSISPEEAPENALDVLFPNEESSNASDSSAFFEGIESEQPTKSK